MDGKGNGTALGHAARALQQRADFARAEGVTLPERTTSIT